MPSPFPGMDPYLEASWLDVHAAIVMYLRDTLQDSLPDALVARVEERVVLELPEGWASGGLSPDVRVIAFTSDKSQPPQGAGEAARPLICEAEDESLTETFIEVIDAESGNKVVTVIEI